MLPLLKLLGHSDSKAAETLKNKELTADLQNLVNLVWRRLQWRAR